MVILSVSGINASSRLLTLEAFSQTQSKAKAAPQQRPARKAPARNTPARKPTARKAAPKRPAVPPAEAAFPTSGPSLANNLAHLIGRTRNGSWGVMVSSVTRGDTLFANNIASPMRPASTLKMLTGAIALDQRGPSYHFTTRIFTDGEILKDGTLRGNVYLVGEGDPSLSTRYFPGEPGAPIQQLADQLKAAGITRITGSVVGDATAFDKQLIPEGWLTRYLGAAYAARVSALSLQDNVVWVAISPNSRGAGPAQVTLEPATTALTLRHSVSTVTGRKDNIRTRKFSDGTIEVSGSINSKSPTRRYSYVVDDPAVFAAGTLHAALLAQGIEVEGRLTLGKTPGKATELASLQSPPLSRLVNAMNRESINLYAELLFRDAARASNGSEMGSVEAGNKAMRKLFTRLKIDTSGLYHADGSGLSTLNRITARTMVQFLMSAHRQQWGPSFHASLPVAGSSETLRRRMNNSQAEANLHAKTGTTDDVVSLAGYVTSANGELLAFSVIYNGADRWIARESIDALGATLANFTRK